MCGRFALGIPKKRLEAVFGLPVPDGYAPRYNAAPGQAVAVAAPEGFLLPRWGLVPPWADPDAAGLINARSETVFDKPSFRDAVRARRCLVPAQAFYEWRRQGRARQPFAFAVEDADVFAMAGILSRRRDGATGAEIDTLAILTCAANAVMAPVHDRMPVILPDSAWGAWLDPATQGPGGIADLLVPYPAQSMRAWPVGAAVNAVGNDGPSLLDRAEIAAPQQGSLL